jgi:RNA polymerase-binding transcription factor DksA
LRVCGARQQDLIPVKGHAGAPGYAAGMKPWQSDQLRRALELRRDALVKELNLDAARLREERGGEWTDVTADIDQLDLTRDLGELRDIEAARRRLDDGNYGICTDCGADIAFERLHAEPEAARCIDCQRRHEKTYRR